MMVQTIRDKLTEARKNRNSVEMAVLQVILGEVSDIEYRKGPVAPERLELIIRKVVENNKEVIAMPIASDAREKLEAENVFLQTLLPQTLSIEEIKSALVSVTEAVKAAKNDGAGTGVAMKHLKALNLKVLGEDVSKAVSEIRQG